MEVIGQDLDVVALSTLLSANPTLVSCAHGFPRAGVLA